MSEGERFGTIAPRKGIDVSKATDERTPDTSVSIDADCSKALREPGEHICSVPRKVAVCPECGSDLYVESTSWDQMTGMPTKDGVAVSCVAEDESIMAWEQNDVDSRPWHEVMHRHWQSDWQSVVDAVAAWCGARVD